MRVSEIRVKRIRVNQGLGVHGNQIKCVFPKKYLVIFWVDGRMRSFDKD